MLYGVLRRESLDGGGVGGRHQSESLEMFDQSSEFGARVARRLREEKVVWLTTVTPSGAPLPWPVGFLWDGADQVLIYSQPGARIRNIHRNPKVTLNFGGDGEGGDIVVLRGAARTQQILRRSP